ncbi:hypothetical protein IMSAGC006_01643 [Muribaculaceae bacterium]|nr:hypothetical protein IMSAGC006_01643 [Muribaculaceae bacterium]
MILARGTVERREDKHQHLRAHAYAEQGVAAGQVKYLEQSAPDHDSGAYGVGEIEEALAALAREKPFNGILISFDCCHIFWPV